MFIPFPSGCDRTNDDSCYIIWKRETKFVLVNLDCYGSSNVQCRIRGEISNGVTTTFEKAWKWFCEAGSELPVDKTGD
jgi:hypothetical protein